MNRKSEDTCVGGFPDLSKVSVAKDAKKEEKEKLIESLEFDIEPSIQTAWTNEAKRRRDEMRNGLVQPIPGEEALAEVRRLL